MLVPDENVGWNLTAIPAALRIVKASGIDVVITTSPPNSVHLVGAAVKAVTGVRWVADLRDSIASHPHRNVERAAVRAKEKVSESVARLVARRADAIVAASEAIADEARGLEPGGEVTTILNGADFDDFAGLAYRRSDRFRITHTGSFFGKRDPRPFLTALAESGLTDVVARFVGDFRASDREWAESLDLGERLELLPYAPRHDALALQRDSDALLLLIPEAGGRGQGRPLGEGVRVSRGRAPDPRGGAAGRRGGAADPGDRRRRRRRVRTTSPLSEQRSPTCTAAGQPARSTESRCPPRTASASGGALGSRSSPTSCEGWSREDHRHALPRDALLRHVGEGALERRGRSRDL